MDVILTLHLFPDFPELSKEVQKEEVKKLVDHILSDELISEEFPFIQSISTEIRND